MDLGHPDSSSPASSHDAQVSRHDSKGEANSGGLSLSASQTHLSETQKQKVVQIERACRDCDIAALVSLASSPDGFVADEVRRTAWPVLIGSRKSSSEGEDWEQLPAHGDEEQIEKDVNRAFVYYPNNESEKQMDKRRKQLSDLIVHVMRRHPQLSYFQGYHDIVQVFLLVLGPEQAVPAVKRLSLLRIRDFMLPALAPATLQLRLIPAILYAADPVLCKHLNSNQPVYALSATLTLYAHDIQEYADIARLFDFLLARDAVVSIYLYAAIILDRKDELLDIPADDPDMQLFQLSKLPHPLDLERLIERTTYLFENHPPATLPFAAWRKISKYSVLKTTGDPAAMCSETLAEGERLFAKQAAELRRQQKLDHVKKILRRFAVRYRRPAVLTVAAVAVGFVAWCVGSGTDTILNRWMLWPLTRRFWGRLAGND